MDRYACQPACLRFSPYLHTLRPKSALSGPLSANCFAANCRTLHMRTCPVNVLSHLGLTNPATQNASRPSSPAKALWLYQFKIKSSLIYEAYGVCSTPRCISSINWQQTFQSINRCSVRYKWQTVNEMKFSFRIQIWQQIFSYIYWGTKKWQQALQPALHDNDDDDGNLLQQIFP